MKRRFAFVAILVGVLSGAPAAPPQSAAWPQVSTFELPAGAGGSVGAAAISPDGKQVAVIYVRPMWSAKDDELKSTIKLWNVGTEEPVRSQDYVVKRADTPPDLWRTFQPYHLQYCDQGKVLLLADPQGTISALDPQSLQVVKTVVANIAVQPNSNATRITCAADTPIAVLEISGGLIGAPGHSKPNEEVKVRVFNLQSSEVIEATNLHREVPVGDIAISPSGAQFAITYVPMNNLTQRPKNIANLQLFDTNSGKMMLEVKTGHLPGGVSFIGEHRVATADVILPGIFGQAKIKIWDANTGQLVKELADPKLGARRRVAASSDGTVVLGYMPHEQVTGERAAQTTSEQRFRLWDAKTYDVIATSPPILPIRSFHEAPQIELSANGRAVLVWSAGLVPVQVYFPNDSPNETH